MAGAHSAGVKPPTGQPVTRKGSEGARRSRPATVHCAWQPRAPHQAHATAPVMSIALQSRQSASGHCRLANVDRNLWILQMAAVRRRSDSETAPFLSSGTSRPKGSAHIPLAAAHVGRACTPSCRAHRGKPPRAPPILRGTCRTGGRGRHPPRPYQGLPGGCIT